MAMNFNEFQWINESSIKTEGDKLAIYATPKGDYFCPGGDESLSVSTAPFYYKEMTGDFVIKAKVSFEFISTYDSACLMVLVDKDNWAKTCLELTAFGTHAIVSVVTKNGESDDANGCNVENDAMWLQVARVGNTFAFHYSFDGETYYLSRCFYYAMPKTVKVGLLAQSPTGEGGDRYFEEVSLESKTIQDARAGM